MSHTQATPDRRTHGRRVHRKRAEPVHGVMYIASVFCNIIFPNIITNCIFMAIFIDIGTFCQWANAVVLPYSMQKVICRRVIFTCYYTPPIHHQPKYKPYVPRIKSSMSRLPHPRTQLRIHRQRCAIDRWLRDRPMLALTRDPPYSDEEENVVRKLKTGES